MASTVFDRETLLDLLVNVIPLGILLFFFGLFLLDNPFGWNLLFSGFQLLIVASMFVSLVALTYFSGRAVAQDEKHREGSPEAELPPGGVPVEGETAEDELPGDEEGAEESAAENTSGDADTGADEDETANEADGDATKDDA